MNLWSAPATVLALALATQAQARDLTPADLRTIEAINTQVNHDAGLIRVSAKDPTCGAYAVNKVFELTLRGFGRDPVAIGILILPDGQRHAVAEIKGEINGTPVTVVLDNLHPHITTRQDLEAEGYAWIEEIGR